MAASWTAMPSLTLPSLPLHSMATAMLRPALPPLPANSMATAMPRRALIPLHACVPWRVPCRGSDGFPAARTPWRVPCRTSHGFPSDMRTLAARRANASPGSPAACTPWRVPCRGSRRSPCRRHSMDSPMPRLTRLPLPPALHGESRADSHTASSSDCIHWPVRCKAWSHSPDCCDPCALPQLP